MYKNDSATTTSKKGILHYLPFVVIALGIVFRLVMYFQNRNLIIDEANIVRNLDERNFIELLKPLKYEQFAPPIFLWFEKLFSLIFGYGEKAARLYPLLCGIASLFFMERILRKILPLNIVWFPLALMCCAPILIKYSAEVKQYVPDSFVAIVLIWLALRTDLLGTSKKRFLSTWIIAGSIAIWASQPSIFTLAAVGLYYFIQCAQQKKWQYLKYLVLIGLVWLAQFGLYFELILKAQINSDYLQNYHRDYFLYAFPKNFQECQHNWMRLKELLSNTGGWGTYPRYINGGLIIIGFVSLLLKSAKHFVLIAVPIVLTIFAAALHQFSLIDRVAIFILPLNMTLLGFGMAQLMQIKVPVLKWCIAAIGCYVLYYYNFLSLFREKFQFHELTKGFEYIIEHNGSGNELYVDCASGPTYIYYTQLHPNKNKWAALQGAHVFGWSEDNYPEVASKITTSKAYFIFTGGDSNIRDRHINEVKSYMHQTDFFQYAYCFVYTFNK
jgi:hypothetical protein